MDAVSAIKDEEVSEMCKKFQQATQSATKCSRGMLPICHHAR